MKAWKFEAYDVIGYVKADSRAKAKWTVIQSIMDAGWKVRIGEALGKIDIHRYPLLDGRKDWKGCRCDEWMDDFATRLRGET